MELTITLSKEDILKIINASDAKEEIFARFQNEKENSI
jgi:hypothetical protein